MNTDRKIELGLMYSRTCNIACKHCGILSSPENKETMRFEDAKRFIREATEIPVIRKVNFTGGEPFLFQKEHAEMFEICKAAGLKTRVVTNGFWAKNFDRGLEFLSRMKEAGLTELNFSADKYHLEFQDPKILRNALECTRRLDFLRILGYVHPGEGDPLDALSDLYGLPREDLVDLRKLLDAREDLQNWKHKILVNAAGLIGLGRAAEYPEELRYFPMSVFPSEGCHEIVNKPVIYPDGDLQACCCAGGKIAGFTVGNLHKESLATLVERMTERAHFKFINDHGPKELYLAVGRSRQDRKRRPGHTSICEVCVRACDGVSAQEMDEIAERASFQKAFAWLLPEATTSATPAAEVE
ncbi:radical SAM protein [Chondromyces crocatus]|uniref:Radical SAM core domain-containing protein n=1 Tax=Chondromyces crocatus TaxID=52 RepID=A0A0K1EJE3_CHOCO|nr:radical SAM protein [Chondromyces crocatus]AKT40991.1 uncharacterized protein CMC5_051480 [Chondromyces crocatus]